jgi:ribulose-phosphate 3-epimerase
MVQIIPGILEKEWGEIEKKLLIVKPFTKAVHIDILDGKFAPSTTFLDPRPFAKYSQDLFLEVHLMVEDPIQYLEAFAKAGFRRFIGQIEMMPNQAEFAAKARSFAEVGLSVDGSTPIGDIKIPSSCFDSITVMAIKAGKSGQVFNPENLRKIEMLKQVQHDIKVEIDGGINDQTISLARNAGADRFIANSFIFNNPNPSLQFNLLRTIAEK